MGFLGGNNTNLYIQAFSGGSTQIIASGDAANLLIGTGYTTAPTHLRFDTSPGGGAAPNPAMYVTSAGNLGIGADGLTASERSEEHTSELQSLMRISYAVFCLKKTIHTIDMIYAQNHCK